MLNAHIEMDLNNHLAVIGSEIISEISSQKKHVIFETLLRNFLRKFPDYSPDQFMDAFTFLFMIDLVDIINFKVVMRNV